MDIKKSGSLFTEVSSFLLNDCGNVENMIVAYENNDVLKVIQKDKQLKCIPANSKDALFKERSFPVASILSILITMNAYLKVFTNTAVLAK